MRVEATVPDSRGAALEDLAKQLGLTRSQIIDEALAFAQMAVMEVRRGRRFVSMGRADNDRTNLMTPTLAQLQWVFGQQALGLSPEAAGRLVDVLDDPPEANDALRAALADTP